MVAQAEAEAGAVGFSGGCGDSSAICWHFLNLPA